MSKTFVPLTSEERARFLEFLDHMAVLSAENAERLATEAQETVAALQAERNNVTAAQIIAEKLGGIAAPDLPASGGSHAH